MPLDTLKAAKRLQEDDLFSPEQAERIAEILSDADLAAVTTADLKDTEARLTQRIDEVEEQFGQRIDETEERLWQRIDGLNQRMGEVEERLIERIDRTAAEQTNTLTKRVGWGIGVLLLYLSLMTYLMNL